VVDFNKGLNYVPKHANVQSIYTTAMEQLYDEKMATRMDSDLVLLGCQSGIIDLRSGGLVQGGELVSVRANATFTDAHIPTPDIDKCFADVFNNDQATIAYTWHAASAGAHPCYSPRLYHMRTW
jgi:hypothetical protein